VVEQRVERKLAAILAADVAGFSRLMGLDEEGTLARLKALRSSLVDPKIDEHRGRIVKTTGDGFLAQFASVVDALRCAVEVQHQMFTRQAATSEEKRIEFRMGINVGDVSSPQSPLRVAMPSTVKMAKWNAVWPRYSLPMWSVTPRSWSVMKPERSRV
jgi:class 3 adenylate cyclase